MSIATHLVTVARSLSDILDDINIELVNKGSTASDTLDGVDEKIRAIPGGGSTQDADAVAGDLRAGKTAYARGSKIVGTLASVMPGVPNVSVSEQGVVTASVTQSAGIVNGATTSATHTLSSDDDSDFVESNIKAGVTIFGVTGNYSGSGIDTQDADAVASDIRTGKTAYVKGVKVTGSLLEKSAQTYTPGTVDQTISSNRILTGVQTIKGDADLIPSNIKSGVNIFGVTGTYSGSGGYDTSDATASASDIRSGQTAYIATGKTTGTMSTVTAPNPSISVSGSGVVTASYSMSSGYTAGGSKSATHTLSSSDDPYFIASNIKNGVNIFGLTGTYTGEGGSGFKGISVSGVLSILSYSGDPTYSSLTISTNVGSNELWGIVITHNSSTDFTTLSGGPYIMSAVLGFPTTVNPNSYNTRLTLYGGNPVTLTYTTSGYSVVFNDSSVTITIPASSGLFDVSNSYYTAVGLIPIY